ncbi:MAG: glycine cleavage system protein GcvH [Promethearchaeota archaeon]
MDYQIPTNINYTATHEWIKIEGTMGIIGITDYAQHQLGDIVFIEFPDVGMVFEKGSNAAEIESVKAVGDLLMPLSGEIIEINEKLINNPELINQSPYKEGWIIKIKINHNDEIEDLLSFEQYAELIEKEDQ